MAEKFEWIKKLTKKGEPKKGELELDKEKIEKFKESQKGRWEKLKEKLGM